MRRAVEASLELEFDWDFAADVVPLSTLSVKLLIDDNPADVITVLKLRLFSAFSFINF